MQEETKKITNSVRAITARSHIAVLAVLIVLLVALGVVPARADDEPDSDSCPSNTANSQAPNKVHLAVADPGVLSSAWDDGTVSLAIAVENSGNTAATNVTIQRIQGPPSSTYLGPTALPYTIGDILPDESEQLNAQFSQSAQQTHAKYPLIIQGSYQFGATVCRFTLHTFVVPTPPSNGGRPKAASVVQTFTVDSAFYPAAPLPRPLDAEPNSDRVLLPPLGQPRNLFTMPPPLSLLDESLGLHANDLLPPPGGNARDVVFVRNQQAGSLQGLPPDPSVAGATPSGFVMASANTAVMFSIDYGKTFTTVPLTGKTGFGDFTRPKRTDFFPESDGGLCCDQVVIYIPGRNLMVWLMQYWSPTITRVRRGRIVQTTGQNRLRIAYATPEAAAADFLHAWRWFDLTPAQIDATTLDTDYFDYPDLAYSSNFLYISVRHGFVNAANQQKVYGDRRFFIQASLDDLINHTPIYLISYEAQRSGISDAHFVQSAPDRMIYAAQPDTSTLSVFVDPDFSPNIPVPHDVKVSSFCATLPTTLAKVVNCNYSAPAPDNLNWNQAPHGVLGGAYVAPAFFCPPEGCNFPTHFLYFAFDGGRDFIVGRPWPYVRVEKLDADTLTLIDEIDLWNPNFALATAALVWRPGSGKDEVAFSLARGGGTRFADNAVGFLGDYKLFETTSSNVTQTDTAGTTIRYGDYFHVRNAVGPFTQAGQGMGYATLGYAVTSSPGQSCSVGGCTVTLQYVLFGRNAELFPNPGPNIN